MRLPLGNQTCLAGKPPLIGGFWLGKSLINGPFSIAMFDYQRVYTTGHMCQPHQDHQAKQEKGLR